MSQSNFSRRRFLKSSATLAKGSLIVLSAPAILTACQQAEETATSQPQAFKILTPEQARELSAIAARIIPSDETPGAQEAGVINFIDAVLSDDRELEYIAVRDALREIQYNTALEFAEPFFADLNTDQQDEILLGMENTEFFATIRYLTIAGMFSLPEYGGNKDKIGYQLIGFNDQHAWAPPFGFYDADYAAKGE